ncbi:hypothetical protein C1645_820117 [Glomus cerebriforme]|uniref:Uncharacterized protein n=1 Tax=Glomus cerebriforme TaxID=658196 RepID=A0A397T662_9GLOM|nr:hypothetical protein C1645_820117 [Glomus cerebriforme]
MLYVDSDFSFVERAIIDVWVCLWFIQRVWSTDRFDCLQWSKLRNFDIKSIITLLLLLMLPGQSLFDIIWTYLKYNEGFVIDKVTNEIFPKPEYLQYGNTKIYLWTDKDIILKRTSEYMLSLVFAFQTGTLALLQAFWSHLSSQIGGKPFIRTWKFKFYVSWVVISFIIFPMARFLTRENEVFVENVPPFIFSTQLLIVFLLGIKNGKRLNKLLDSIKHTYSPSGQETISRIHYFIEMNRSIMFGSLMMCIALLTTTLNTIAFNQAIKSKLFMDFHIIHANFGSLILWVTMILIIYPRYYISSGRIMDTSSYSTLDDHYYHASLEMGNNQSEKLKNGIKKDRPTSFIVNSSQPITNDIIKKSISSLLEEQKQQFEYFRHKTSASFSSTTTIATSNFSHDPTSPLFPPPPPLIPPPTIYEKPSYNNKYKS